MANTQRSIRSQNNLVGYVASRNLLLPTINTFPEGSFLLAVHPSSSLCPHRSHIVLWNQKRQFSVLSPFRVLFLNQGFTYITFRLGSGICFQKQFFTFVALFYIHTAINKSNGQFNDWIANVPVSLPYRLPVLLCQCTHCA